MDIPPIQNGWFLTGPTASGKSAVGVELAQRLDAEIISIDSMALYRRMDIGTAKPTAEQRRAIPHHLIDVIEPSEEYSLAQYLEAAHHTAAEIASRGKQVLFVGGTPLYLKGLLRGVFQGPPADWDFRKRIAEQAGQNPSDWLHNQVARIDPDAATRLHPNDTRRLIRAWEVFEKTGRPISEFQRQFETGRSADECRVFVLDWPRPALQSRIRQRVDEMFAAGLVEEVRCLLVDTVALSRSASQAVGYREVIEHIEGRHTLSETIDLVDLHTKQLAKRQCTWFRSLSECRSIAMTEKWTPAALTDQIILFGR